jgi:hypothetical protein
LQNEVKKQKISRNIQTHEREHVETESDEVQANESVKQSFQ